MTLNFIPQLITVRTMEAQNCNVTIQYVNSSDTVTEQGFQYKTMWLIQLFASTLSASIITVVKQCMVIMPTIHNSRIGRHPVVDTVKMIVKDICKLNCPQII